MTDRDLGPIIHDETVTAFVEKVFQSDNPAAMASVLKTLVEWVYRKPSVRLDITGFDVKVSDVGPGSAKDPSNG